MEQLIKFLEENGVKLNSNLRDRLNKFKTIYLKKGDFFVPEGRICKTIAFINEGKIRHYYNIDGKEHTRWVSLKNNFVTAFASFVNITPSKENLICLEDVELICMNRSDFFSLKNDFTEIQDLWVCRLEYEMTGYEQRVLELISSEAETKYLNFIKTYPLFVQDVPQKYIASMLGIEPRHLSRIRKKLYSKKK